MIDGDYREHASFVWGLCYRMTGSAADADDLVQDTFARAVAAQPARQGEPLRPWLVRVAVNLARDRLRRRKRAPYVGPWLPSPIATGDEAADDAGDPERRYGMLESVSFAFLLACEALTPRQRAVLLLRDVLDYSVEETARALSIGEANVKTTLHRARAAMRAYDAARRAPTRAQQGASRAALERLAAALATGDAASVAALLAPDAVTRSDGGGEFRAALRPVIGASRVARFYLGLLEKKAALSSAALRMLNGAPALVMDFALRPGMPSFAPRGVVLVDVGADERVTAVHTVLSSAKLAHVFARPPRDGAARPA